MMKEKSVTKEKPMSSNDEYKYPGNSMSEEELLARIAWFYYHDGLTQGDIGELLGLTRLKVSRLLEKGRQSGVIRVQINSRYEGCLELENTLQQHFGLKHIRILPSLADLSISRRLGIGAAHLLMALEMLMVITWTSIIYYKALVL